MAHQDRARGMMVGLTVIRIRFEGEEHFEDHGRP